MIRAGVGRAGQTANRWAFRAIFALAPLFGSSCVDVAAPADESDIPFDITVITGANQSGREHSMLADAIVAIARRGDGVPAAGVRLAVEVISGNGMVEVGEMGADGNGAVVTDGEADGRIEVLWTVGPAEQPQRLRVFAEDRAEIAVLVDAVAVSGG